MLKDVGDLLNSFNFVHEAQIGFREEPGLF
jgi:hypothetical protein